MKHSFRKSQKIKRGAIVATLVFTFLLTVVTVYAAGPSAMDQCKTGSPPTGTCDWVGGILNPGANTYFEGMATPQRMLFTGLSTSAVTHTITFDMQWTKAGLHAYDWPVSWAQAETLAQSIGKYSLSIDPTRCDDLNPSDTTACNTTTFTATANVPVDPYVSGQYGLPATDGSTANKLAAFIPVYGTPQIEIAANQGITFSVRTPVHDVANGADTGDSKVTYTLDITRTGATGPSNMLLMFAAHIAVSDAPGDPAAPEVTWGQGYGAKNISGAPYHVQSVCIDGGCSSQDNQLNLNGSPLTPALVTRISNTSRTFGQSVTDTVTMTLSSSTVLSGTLNFYVCGPTASPTECLPQNTPQYLVSSHPVSTTGTSVVRTSNAFTPNANGVWCFRAVWLNEDYNTQSWETFATTNECVTVSSSTAVQLSSMRASRGENGISLIWVTGSEVNTAGFNIYRSERAEGPYVRINTQLIPAAGDRLLGAKYQYQDVNVVPGQTYYYQLEDVELNGTSVRHKPVAVTASSASANVGIAVLVGLWIGVVGALGAALLIVLKRIRKANN